MSAFHGPQERAPMRARGRNKGARALHRARKRMAAEIRDDQALPGRRAAFRRDAGSR